MGALIHGRRDALASDVFDTISRLSGALDSRQWRGLAESLVRLFAAGVDPLPQDALPAAIHELDRYCPPISVRDLFDAVHHAERVILDEIALDARLGVTSESWPAVTYAIRRTSIDLLGVYSEQIAGRAAPVVVRDSLTTLIASPVFELAVSQEIERAVRHKHALALLLFDIDHLSQINREHGRGVGDRLLERIGILARRFFRTHDWVARHGDDAIGVLLPETTLDQGAVLAARFTETVQHRLVLQNHNTGVTRAVTVSAAAVGTDQVQSGIDGAYVIAEAEGAVIRAKLNGRNRVERVALLPTSLTIVGAALVLGQTPREVAQLIRSGALRASRRGRHFHIERDLIEAYRKTAR
jgi:diguanylate cyclase (GGDEF)-like protein